MNTRTKALEEINSFLQSNHRFMLLTGTFQTEKHPLVLAAILTQFPTPATILFRANHANHFDTFLSPVLKLSKKPKTGTPIAIQGGYTLYIDTTNRSSWGSSPSNIDIAVVYPIDSLSLQLGDECVQDLIARKAKKIILVSWTDNKDFSWVNQFSPIPVAFDAEEERPDYHQRMIEILPHEPLHERPTGLPSYAQSTQSEYLIQILCRGKCGSMRWAKLNKPFPGMSTLKSAPMMDYRATCLKCGYVASDNYNWGR